jgi:hypothetical protein
VNIFEQVTMDWSPMTWAGAGWSILMLIGIAWQSLRKSDAERRWEAYLRMGSDD